MVEFLVIPRLWSDEHSDLMLLLLFRFKMCNQTVTSASWSPVIGTLFPFIIGVHRHQGKSSLDQTVFTPCFQMSVLSEVQEAIREAIMPSLPSGLVHFKTQLAMCR